MTRANIPGEWIMEGLCAQVDGDLWFPEGPGAHQTTAARRICQRCPVVAICLEWALTTNQTYGVWGGTSPADRRRLLGRSKNVTCHECGETFAVPSNTHNKKYCSDDCRSAMRLRQWQKYEVRKKRRRVA